MRGSVREQWWWVVVATIIACIGCTDRRSEAEVSIERDIEAVNVRFHNRCGTELVVKPFVRHDLESVPVGGAYRMPTVYDSERENEKPDLELAVFKFLPLKREDIGAYAVEVTTPGSDVRVAVIDVTKEEMALAKDEGRLSFVFRADGVTVVIGTTTTTLPWLRPFPGTADASKP